MDSKIKARPGSLDNLHDCAVTLRHFAPAGVTLEMVQEPAYWSNVTREAAQQRIVGRHAWNKIEVLAEDGTWEAELRVVSITMGEAGTGGLVTTRLLRQWPEKAAPEAKQTPPPQGYTVEHVQDNGWRARDPDGAVIAEKRTTRNDALAAASSHAAKAKGGR